jgi:hypothetical protein
VELHVVGRRAVDGRLGFGQTPEEAGRPLLHAGIERAPLEQRQDVAQPAMRMAGIVSGRGRGVVRVLVRVTMAMTMPVRVPVGRAVRVAMVVRPLRLLLLPIDDDVHLGRLQP